MTTSRTTHMYAISLADKEYKFEASIITYIEPFTQCSVCSITRRTFNAKQSALLLSSLTFIFAKSSQSLWISLHQFPRGVILTERSLFISPLVLQSRRIHFADYIAIRLLVYLQLHVQRWLLLSRKIMWEIIVHCYLLISDIERSLKLKIGKIKLAHKIRTIKLLIRYFGNLICEKLIIFNQLFVNYSSSTVEFGNYLWNYISCQKKIHLKLIETRSCLTPSVVKLRKFNYSYLRCERIVIFPHFGLRYPWSIILGDFCTSREYERQ